MSFQHHEYDLLTVLDAEAIGEPGQRRFRLIVGTPGDIISLWMEKEQLSALGVAIEQLLEQLREARLIHGAVEPEPAPSPTAVPLGGSEYLVSKMAIGFDEERTLVALFAHDVEQEDDGEPIFSGRATLTNAKALADRIVEVVAAGRRAARAAAPPSAPRVTSALTKTATSPGRGSEPRGRHVRTAASQHDSRR